MSQSDPKRQRFGHPFFWCVLIVGLLMLGVYAFAGVIAFRYGAVTTDYGWEAQRRGNAWYVTSVDPGGAAAGLLAVNDRVLAVQDDTRIALVGPSLKTIPPASRYTVRVARSDGEHEVTLYGPLKHDNGRLGRTFSYLILSIAFLV